MEDVVLHYQPGSAAGLSSLLERAEKLLEPFPCRTPLVFTPWFPTSTAGHRLPIRPAKPAPVITFSGDIFVSDNRLLTDTAAAKVKTLSESRLQPSDDSFVPEKRHDRPRAGTIRTTPVNPQKNKDAACVPPTSDHLLPASLCDKPERGVTRLSPKKWTQNNKDGFTITDSPIRRSWSVFTQRGVLLQSSQSLSKQFHHMVSTHRLHLRQRVKWVISEHNCGAARGIEQVWHTVSRSIQSSRLPTCNANIQRERAEIWVFCDVLYSEQVGRFLKDELQLSGRISLSVRTLGNIFSM